jgi:hypothetical protein
VLSSERREEPGVANGLRIEELALDLRRTREGVGESITDAQAGFPYFCRKRSTRPAVSTNFCFPVKNGWQTLQMSVWISAIVERVWNVFPHAHFTVAVAYSGWISAFIGASNDFERQLGNIPAPARKRQADKDLGTGCGAADIWNVRWTGCSGVIRRDIYS